MGRPLDAGSRLAGKYRVVRRLAVGGMGEVWAARNEATGAAVALKVLHAGHDEDFAARFRNEAQLAARLAHRNIVRVYDWIEGADEELALVMELLRGESLARYLDRNGPLANDHAAAIIVPILGGLAHAHACGIVHRDVAPANLFLALDPDGHVTPKIVDFGLAKLPRAAPHTLDGQVLGTPRYMSPEQIRGEPLDGRSDLFGVAAVLHEMIAGRSPFAAATPAASLAAVLEVPVDPHPRIEPRLWLEVQRALSKRAYERPASAAEMADGLRAALRATDASLAAVLAEAAPVDAGDAALPEQDDDTRGAPEVRAPPGTTPAPIAPPAVARRRSRVRSPWPIVALLLAAIVAVALTLRARTSAEAAATHVLQHPATAPVAASPATALSPDATSAGPQARPPASTISPAVSVTPPAGPPAPARTPVPRRARPVATTPGF